MMEQVPTSVLSAERCHLGEGPTYDIRTDTAWWFDILEGRLFEAHLSSGRISVHRLGRMASALARIDREDKNHCGTTRMAGSPEPSSSQASSISWVLTRFIAGR